MPQAIARTQEVSTTSSPGRFRQGAGAGITVHDGAAHAIQSQGVSPRLIRHHYQDFIAEEDHPLHHTRDEGLTPAKLNGLVPSQPSALPSGKHDGRYPHL